MSSDVGGDSEVWHRDTDELRHHFLLLLLPAGRKRKRMKRTEVERPVNSWMWVRVSLIGAGRCEGKTEGTLCLL